MTRHLGTDIRAYVDRSMDPRVLLAFDRHLVACVGCRHAAESERRLVAALRDGPTPGVPTDLHTMLLRMASLPPGAAPAEHGTAPSRAPSRLGPAGVGGTTSSIAPDTGYGLPSERAVPSIPVAPHALRPLRLPTVAPAAPAMHRSPRRAAVLAGLAAGASAAAAIGLSMAGPGQATATVRQPVVGATLSGAGTSVGWSASIGSANRSGLPQVSTSSHDGR